MNEIMPKEKKNPKEQIIDEHENKTDNFLKNKDNRLLLKCLPSFSCFASFISLTYWTVAERD